MNNIKNLSRLFFLILMFFSIMTHADVTIFDKAEYKIYVIKDATTKPNASLFTSIDPQEKFIQTAANYAGSVNVFIIEFKDDNKRIMIDTGFGNAESNLLPELKKAGIPAESISDILITHIHPDHVGGLLEFPDAKVYIAKLEYDSWQKDSSRKSLSTYLPKTEKLVLFEYNTEVICGLHAIKASGHTPGHTIFQIDDCYFVGDILHAAELQIEHPSFCARYDINPQEAANCRKNALRNFHGEWYGAHIPFPGKLQRKQNSKNLAQ